MPTDDPTPEPDAPPVDPPADPAPAEPAPEPTPEPAAEAAPWFESALSAASGWAKDNPAGDEAQYAEMAKGITAESISKLDPSAQAIVRAVMLSREKDVAAAQAALDAKNKTFDEREAKAKAAEDRARAQIASLAKVANSDQMKALLDRAKSKAPSETTTEEGRQALLQREVAKNLAEVFKPVNDEAATMQREAAWDQFLDRWPAYKDKANYDRLTAFLNERDAAGRRVDADTAAEILAAQDSRTRAEAAAAEERRVRAAAAAHVNRSRGAASAQKPGIPDDVRLEGRSYEYLKEHPEVLAEMRRQAGMN
jgi:hypothetical protein